MPVSDEGIAYSRRMVAVLIDGLRNPAELQRSSTSCSDDLRDEPDKPGINGKR
jgi:hypothetical protein